MPNAVPALRPAALFRPQGVDCPNAACALEEVRDPEGEARVPSSWAKVKLTSVPLASFGTPFSKTALPKRNGPGSRSSSCRSHPVVTEFQASFDRATPRRRTVSSAKKRSSKPPAIMCVFGLIPSKAKKPRKSFGVTSMAALPTPPFVCLLPMARSDCREVTAAPITFSARTSLQDSTEFPKSTRRKHPPKKQRSPTFRAFVSA